MKRILKHTALLLLVLFMYSCGNNDLRPVLTHSADNFNIAILGDNGKIKRGSGKFFLEFRDSKNDQPTDAGNVEVHAEMPMPGMPMVNDAKVEKTGQAGRYEVNYEFEMSGSWNLTVKYNSDKAAFIPLSID